MSTDFVDSHDRHLVDANQLFSSGRFANADQLYGFSVECGLKSLMKAFGMPFDNVKQMPQKSSDTVHADKVWDRFESYRSSHTSGAGYQLNGTNPFQDWNASQRYYNQSSFDAAKVSPHKAAADQVNQLIRKAKLAGLV
ncbi:SAM-dependent methyltransferase [Enterobacter sp. BNK-29]|uniref:SAM-dependent methyltransferase n=1 Tax=Enterobacter sp. BNK-29 TaxID=3376164 RepID=UPI003B5027FF